MRWCSNRLRRFLEIADVDSLQTLDKLAGDPSGTMVSRTPDLMSLRHRQLQFLQQSATKTAIDLAEYAESTAPELIGLGISETPTGDRPGEIHNRL